VALETDDGLVVADRCICSLPISLLQRGEPVLSPGLPQRHREALARIGMGVVEKVLLRFEERWWPAPERGYMRWYDNPASWCEWVDLTDGCGAPVVAGLIAHDAVTRHHHGRSDTEIARAATAALQRWASAVRHR
jgi:monoamine oxidase